MARRKDKEKAIKLRKQGLSYSQIKDHVNVSKSTLSLWLQDLPLSKEKLHELQYSEAIIEKIRIAKRKTREKRLAEVYKKVSTDIGRLSEREILIAGFFLYWAEGGKTKSCTVTLSNTDPAMIRFYLHWLSVLNVDMDRVFVRLHLYSDMNIEKEIRYWSAEIKLARKKFRKPYIKKSKFSSISYSTFGHGTCNVILYGRDVSEYVLQGLKKISSIY